MMGPEEFLNMNFPDRDRIPVTDLSESLNISRPTIWRMIKASGCEPKRGRAGGLTRREAAKLLSEWLDGQGRDNRAFRRNRPEDLKQRMIFRSGQRKSEGTFTGPRILVTIDAARRIGILANRIEKEGK